MTDSKYFTTTKKGEIFELKAELNSDKKEKKKEAVKKVIASMTVGKDVSALFTDVVNCMQTENLELKNNIDVFYFSCTLPNHVLFMEDGEMDKKEFLTSWKEIPTTNEVQYVINDVQHNADTVSQKLRNNNVFTIAKRNVEGQDMLYQSLKLSNGIKVLAELKIAPSNPNFTLSMKCRVLDIYTGVQSAYETILHN